MAAAAAADLARAEPVTFDSAGVAATAAAWTDTDYLKSFSWRLTRLLSALGRYETPKKLVYAKDLRWKYRWMPG